MQIRSNAVRRSAGRAPPSAGRAARRASAGSSASDSGSNADDAPKRRAAPAPGRPPPRWRSPSSASAQRPSWSIDRRQQADLLARRAQENAQARPDRLVLSTRLQAVETAKGRDELAELRRSVGDMKSATATSRELSAAIAQLSQRVERLDREQGAEARKARRTRRPRDERPDRRPRRPPRQAREEARAAGAAAASTPPPRRRNSAANVSMDPTGSIERPRQVLRGYVVLGAQDDMALIGGRYGERAVRAGDSCPAPAGSSGWSGRARTGSSSPTRA